MPKSIVAYLKKLSFSNLSKTENPKIGFGFGSGSNIFGSLGLGLGLGLWVSVSVWIMIEEKITKNHVRIKNSVVFANTFTFNTCIILPECNGYPGPLPGVNTIFFC